MSYKIEATPHFLNEAKKLSKKYPPLRNDISTLAEELAENPTKGTPIGKDFYKIRLAIASKGRGKSGGARVITCVKIVANTVYFAAIYDKSDEENITDKELKEIAKQIP
jgi:mRNA-degrading endonuclease RelE of RelBE toxin-antitoxin system